MVPVDVGDGGARFAVGRAVWQFVVVAVSFATAGRASDQVFLEVFRRADRVIGRKPLPRKDLEPGKARRADAQTASMLAFWGISPASIQHLQQWLSQTREMRGLESALPVQEM